MRRGIVTLYTVSHYCTSTCLIRKDNGSGGCDILHYIIALFGVLRKRKKISHFCSVSK